MISLRSPICNAICKRSAKVDSHERADEWRDEYKTLRSRIEEVRAAIRSVDGGREDG
jgi:hypothetical protein